MLACCGEAGKHETGEVIANQVCSGAESGVLVSSDYVLSSYIDTLVTLGKHEEAVEAFGGEVERVAKNDLVLSAN